MDAQAVLALAGAIVVFGGALAAIQRWIVQPLVNAAHRVSILDGLPRDVAEIKTRLTSLETEVGAIKHEVHPDSNRSMRDAVDRTEEQVNRLRVGVEAVNLRLDRHMEMHILRDNRG